MEIVGKKMAKITNSTVGYIALLWQLASFARLGRRSLLRSLDIQTSKRLDYYLAIIFIKVFYI